MTRYENGEVVVLVRFAVCNFTAQHKDAVVKHGAITFRACIQKLEQVTKLLHEPHPLLYKI